MQDDLSWGRPTSLAHSSLVGGNERNTSFVSVFSLWERSQVCWILEWLQQNVTEDGWRILNFLYVFLTQHICNHNIENCVLFLERSLINLIWFGEVPINDFGLRLICLDETVRRLLVKTGLKEYELAVKLVQQHCSWCISFLKEDLKTNGMSKFIFYCVEQTT